MVTLLYHITYKLCVLMLLVHTGRSPSYMSNRVTATANLSSRQALRSAISQRYEVPRTKPKFRERAFSFAGPSAWNSLPSDHQKQSDTKTLTKLLKMYATFVFVFRCRWSDILCNIVVVQLLSNHGQFHLFNCCSPTVVQLWSVSSM